MSAFDAISQVVSALRAHAIRHGVEVDMQAAVSKILDGAGIDYTREARLGKRDRVDFFTYTGVAIELKVDGATNAVLAQLIRYATHNIVNALVLVTTRAQHDTLPAALLGKPLRVVVVGGLA